eukprot:2738801-Pleurochrysis_carterae.AAC.1
MGAQRTTASVAACVRCCTRRGRLVHAPRALVAVNAGTWCCARCSCLVRAPCAHVAVDARACRCACRVAWRACRARLSPSPRTRAGARAAAARCALCAR